MMALTMALVALTIDAMLPALDVIGEELGASNRNDAQYIVYSVFVGLGFGQLVFGPLADSWGRKRAIYAGLAVFSLGTIISLLAQTFEAMIIGRLLQGLGVAGPRTVSVAIVRDRFEGRFMARVMSFILTIFILVPAIAPTLGQWMINWLGWRSIFGLFLVLVVLISVWFALRQTETLRPENRHALTLDTIATNFRRVASNRISRGYMLAAGWISGAFVGFLGSAQQVLQELYQLGDAFGAHFAALALSVGVSGLINGSIVVRVGMRTLSKISSVMVTLVSLLLLAAVLTAGGKPPLWQLMACLMSLFMFVGFLFGNLNALAMEPLGKIAGTGAAVVGAVTTLLSAVVGAATGILYNGSATPLAVTFLSMGALTTLTIFMTDHG